MLIVFLSFRYLHQQFNRLQEEVNLLKSNLVKYKVAIFAAIHFPFLIKLKLL